MKHILETKHSEEGFKAAVIVNDMAELNIDAALVEALVETDANKKETVIAMQNGCLCCTLQSDLANQIIELCGQNKYNYILIEASGVSEPAEIAPLFDVHQDHFGHDHAGMPQLGEVAKLDTCVTVIDAAEFHSNLDSMKRYTEGEQKGTIAELMIEQVEFSNVILLNKTDLVNDEQQQDIMDRISILNPNAKVLKSLQSKVDVMEIVNTNLYSKAMSRQWMSYTKVKATEEITVELTEECCKKSIDEGKKKCCKSKAKNGMLIDSGHSQIILGVVNNKKKTRHEARFGISSFIYRARRPFHPDRLFQLFLEPFFMTGMHDPAKNLPDSYPGDLDKKQAEAVAKQNKRKALMGELMRSKGFIWMASSMFLKGAWQQAGNVLDIKPSGPWLCEVRHTWEGTPLEPIVMSQLEDEFGEVNSKLNLVKLVS